MIDVHVHVPAGAQKNDGLSAGVAIVRHPLFLSGLGVNMTVVGLITGLCGHIPLDRGVCPSHDCHDRRMRQKLLSLTPALTWVSPFCRLHCADGYRPSAGSKKTHPTGANRVILAWANRKDVESEVVMW